MTWRKRSNRTSDPDGTARAGVEILKYLAEATIAAQEGDHELAEQWGRKAADAGSPLAMFNVGVTAERQGKTAEALGWYRKAAQAGNVSAMNSLGLLLFEQPGQTEQALGWCTKAAESGDANAMFNLGARAERMGDVWMALNWYQDAVDAGDPDALARMDALMKRPESIDRAIGWMTKAAALGKPAAMFNLGLLETQRGNLTQAIDWYTNAADAGFSPAMNNLGNLAVDRGEVDQAIDWYVRAAEAGFAPARFKVGALAVKRGNIGLATHWWRADAEAGNPDAMFNLGVLDEQRSHIEQAIGWYQKAASAGHAQSEVALRDLGAPGFSNLDGPRPIAAFDGDTFGPRLPLRLMPPGEPIGSPDAIGRAMEAAEQRASDGDIGAYLDAAVWWLTISACDIQNGQYQSALEDFKFAHKDFVWHFRAGGPASAWKDVRHAAAWFNRALASWSDGQHNVSALDAADRLLDGVTDANDQDSSYRTVKSAVDALRRLLS